MKKPHFLSRSGQEIRFLLRVIRTNPNEAIGLEHGIRAVYF